MRNKSKDIFGRLHLLSIVREPDAKGQLRSYAVCRCNCGNDHKCRLDGLRSGSVQSCGCLQREAAAEYGKSNITHGQSRRGSRHPLYNVWNHMRRRCQGYDNPTCKAEVDQNKNYRDRGITVCEEWNSFQNFLQWSLQNGWEPGLTIDRIDNDDSYTPENCRYVTRVVQNNNSRKNRRVAAFGETKTIGQWSRDERCKVSYNVLYERLTKLNWNTEDAISLPMMRHEILAEYLKGINDDRTHQAS